MTETPSAPRSWCRTKRSHRGRKSQRLYRTPLWAFRRQGGFVIALTYGFEADWVRNVLAADGCEIEARGRRYQVGSPRVYHDENATDMPAFIRFMLHRARIRITRVRRAPLGSERGIWKRPGTVLVVG
ncbi:hypothetical protein [Mycolicibacterium sp. XJ879]